MPSQTAAPWSIPYPLGTDRVMDGDNSMQAIAERMNALFNQNILAAPVPQTSLAPQTGWAGTVAYFVRSGVVTVFLEITKASWAAGEGLAQLPVPYRPYLSTFIQGRKHVSGGPVLVQLRSDGYLVVMTAGSSENGISGYFTFLYGNTTP
jgi:hypothetical protein